MIFEKIDDRLAMVQVKCTPNSAISDEQIGFVQGKGIADASLVVRNIIQEVIKKQESTEHWLLFCRLLRIF